MIAAFPDFELSFVLDVDASGQGLGCGLFQIQKGVTRVTKYGSFTLVGAEQKYHSYNLEFLALKWTFCDHFKEYLYYAKSCDVLIIIIHNNDSNNNNNNNSNDNNNNTDNNNTDNNPSPCVCHVNGKIKCCWTEMNK